MIFSFQFFFKISMEQDMADGGEGNKNNNADSIKLMRNFQPPIYSFLFNGG